MPGPADAQPADGGGSTDPRAGPQKVDGIPPSWGTISEAVSVCLHRPNRRRIALIAVVVGTLLVGINQGSVLASGNVDWVVWVRMVVDYVIPTCVSTMGVVAGSRWGTGPR